MSTELLDRRMDLVHSMQNMIVNNEPQHFVNVLQMDTSYPVRISGIIIKVFEWNKDSIAEAGGSVSTEEWYDKTYPFPNYTVFRVCNEVFYGTTQDIVVDIPKSRVKDFSGNLIKKLPRNGEKVFCFIDINHKEIRICSDGMFKDLVAPSYTKSLIERVFSEIERDAKTNKDEAIIDMLTSDPVSFFKNLYENSENNRSDVDKVLKNIKVNNISLNGEAAEFLAAYQNNENLPPAIYAGRIDSQGNKNIGPLDINSPNTIKMYHGYTGSENDEDSINIFKKACLNEKEVFENYSLLRDPNNYVVKELYESETSKTNKETPYDICPVSDSQITTLNKIKISATTDSYLFVPTDGRMNDSVSCVDGMVLVFRISGFLTDDFKNKYGIDKDTNPELYKNLFERTRKVTVTDGSTEKEIDYPVNVLGYNGKTYYESLKGAQVNGVYPEDRTDDYYFILMCSQDTIKGETMEYQFIPVKKSDNYIGACIQNAYPIQSEYGQSLYLNLGRIIDINNGEKFINTSDIVGTWWNNNKEGNSGKYGLIVDGNYVSFAKKDENTLKRLYSYDSASNTYNRNIVIIKNLKKKSITIDTKFYVASTEVYDENGYSSSEPSGEEIKALKMEDNYKFERRISINPNKLFIGDKKDDKYKNKSSSYSENIDFVMRTILSNAELKDGYYKLNTDDYNNNYILSKDNTIDTEIGNAFCFNTRGTLSNDESYKYKFNMWYNVKNSTDDTGVYYFEGDGTNYINKVTIYDIKYPACIYTKGNSSLGDQYISELSTHYNTSNMGVFKEYNNFDVYKMEKLNYVIKQTNGDKSSNNMRNIFFENINEVGYDSTKLYAKIRLDFGSNVSTLYAPDNMTEFPMDPKPTQAVTKDYILDLKARHDVDKASHPVPLFFYSSKDGVTRLYRVDLFFDYTKTTDFTDKDMYTVIEITDRKNPESYALINTNYPKYSIEFDTLLFHHPHISDNNISDIYYMNMALVPKPPEEYKNNYIKWMKSEKEMPCWVLFGDTPAKALKYLQNINGGINLDYVCEYTIGSDDDDGPKYEFDTSITVKKWFTVFEFIENALTHYLAKTGSNSYRYGGSIKRCIYPISEIEKLNNAGITKDRKHFTKKADGTGENVSISSNLKMEYTLNPRSLYASTDVDLVDDDGNDYSTNSENQVLVSKNISGLNSTMSVSLLDEDGQLLTLNGSSGDIDKDNLNWFDLLVALSNNKSINILGSNMTSLKKSLNSIYNFGKDNTSIKYSPNIYYNMKFNKLTSNYSLSLQCVDNSTENYNMARLSNKVNDLPIDPNYSPNGYQTIVDNGLVYNIIKTGESIRGIRLINSEGVNLTAGDHIINGYPYNIDNNGNINTGFRLVFGKKYIYKDSNTKQPLVLGFVNVKDTGILSELGISTSKTIFPDKTSAGGTINQCRRGLYYITIDDGVKIGTLTAIMEDDITFNLYNSLTDTKGTSKTVTKGKTYEFTFDATGCCTKCTELF